MSLNNVKSQERAVKFLEVVLKSKRLAHSYIFSGPRGVGKKLTAYEFAKAVNCEKLPYQGCDFCQQCILIAKGLHPDVILVQPQESEEIKIAQVRSILELLYLKPHHGRRKFFIIEPADSMNPEASNALLKGLEEPPLDTTFILITEFPEKLPATIVSRCQRVFFNPLPFPLLKEIIQTKYHCNEEKAAFIAKFAEGSMERAVSLLNKDIDKIWDETLIFFRNGEFNEKLPLSEMRNLLKEKLEILGYFLHGLYLNFKGIERQFLKFYELRINNMHAQNLLSLLEDIDSYIRLLHSNVNPKMVYFIVKEKLTNLLMGVSL